VPALLTVWVILVDALPAKFVSPLNVVAIVCTPVLRPDNANVPIPAALMLTGVCGTPSTLNVNVPVRVPAPGTTTLTVPVKVTDCPKTEGFNDELTPVIVAAWLTV